MGRRGEVRPDVFHDNTVRVRVIFLRRYLAILFQVGCLNVDEPGWEGCGVPAREEGCAQHPAKEALGERSYQPNGNHLAATNMKWGFTRFAVTVRIGRVLELGGRRGRGRICVRRLAVRWERLGGFGRGDRSL